MANFLTEVGADAKAPWVRVVILLVSLAVACGVAYATTGSTLPSSPEDSFLFQSALLMIVLGTALVEYNFTRPADAAVNALSGIVALLGVYYVAPVYAWWATFGLCALVFTLGIACVAVSAGPRVSGWRRVVADWTFRPATILGRAQVLFSVLFIFGLYAFKEIQSPQTVLLVLFWGAFVVIWPLGVPGLLGALLRPRRAPPNVIGTLLRTDSPNLVRVELRAGTRWDRSAPATLQRADGTQHVVLPLYSQPVEGAREVGTGICLAVRNTRVLGLSAGEVCELPAEHAPSSETILNALGVGPSETFLGFVVEDSRIESIRFEVWDASECREGLLVFAVIGATRVYYQIASGLTREETLEEGRHGYQLVTAVQIGVVSEEGAFTKYPWLPTMNAPVFASADGVDAASIRVNESDFVYGSLPGTGLALRGDWLGALDHHTAILGVTGSGKTEMAFTMIRHAVASGVRVLCIDLTSRYRPRLADLDPVNLSISAESSGKLGALMFEAETGAYGAGAEKKALKSFDAPLRADVREALKQFLEQPKGEGMLGIISLEEISNTKATLAITEMYMSGLLESAKARGAARERVLVVLEEAHTLVPEASTVGLGDFDSKGMVAKIAQIALQGRKYGVGLLVLAQRTATVSKSILSQCNTTISFSCFDETSVKFLGNIFGETFAAMLPNLKRLQAVAFGMGVRAERPIVFEVPFDISKKRAADAADGRS